MSTTYVSVGFLPREADMLSYNSNILLKGIFNHLPSMASKRTKDDIPVVFLVIFLTVLLT